MFNHYLVHYSSFEDQRIFHRLVEGRVNIGKPIVDVNFYKLYDKYRLRFFIFILSTINGHAGSWQRFYLSFLLEFKGVSRSGLAVVSALGLGTKLTSYDSYRKSELDKADLMIE